MHLRAGRRKEFMPLRSPALSVWAEVPVKWGAWHPNRVESRATASEQTVVFCFECDK